MGVLSQEVSNVQNPALGAVLLWRFASGYGLGSKVNSPSPLPLLFIVLPIILHEETAVFIANTRRTSGLRAFVNKFAASNIARNDMILAIQDRSLKMRDLSLDSLRIAITSKLISVDTANGSVIPLSSTPLNTGVPESVKILLKNAEKLGYWCSEVSLYEISTILKVAF